MITLLAATAAQARAVVDAVGPLPARVSDWPHADTADVLRSLADYPDLSGVGTFLVVHDGLVVGECGWCGPPYDGEVLIRYGIAPSQRGRGLGGAAVLALCAWAHGQGAVTVRAEVRPANVPSQRLLARAGFTCCGNEDDHQQWLRAAGRVGSDGIGQYVRP